MRNHIEPERFYQKLTLLWDGFVKSASWLCVAAGTLSLVLGGCGAEPANSPASNGVAQSDIETIDAVMGAASQSVQVEDGLPVLAPAKAVEFPEQFLGNWDYDSEGCGEDESGTKFRITDTQIIGYEETSTLKSIDVVDDLVIRVVLENHSSDGIQQVRQTMRLSPVAGITMRIQTGDKTIRTLRCDPV